MTSLDGHSPSTRSEASRVVRQTVRAAGLTRTNGVMSLVRGGVLVAALAPTTAAVVATGSWWAWLAHIAAATLVLSTLQSVYHEGAHRNLARNRFLNDAAGVLAALLNFVPFETWRYFHLAHHANTGTDEDSELYPDRWSRAMLLAFPLTQWLFIGLLWRWTILTLSGGGPRWVRNPRQVRAVRLSTAATAAGLVAIAVAVALDTRIVGLLLVPAALSVMVSSYTLVPEHFPAYRIGPGEPDQLDRTNSFRSNPLVRLLMWNSNFHAAHHFAPKVPAHHLPRVDAMISGLQDARWRWDGYGSWYRAQLGKLPWRLR